MSDEIRVRVAGRSFSYRGESYDHDDELTVGESTLEQHPNTLEVTEDGSGETDDGYTRDELESMDWSDLRQMAVESEREDINGRSSKADIVEALAND